MKPVNVQGLMRQMRFSLVARYTLLSLAVTAGALVVLSVLYERMAGDLYDRLTGERLNAQVTATASRLTSFLDNRLYQLANLSNHPSIPSFLDGQNTAAAAEATALLRLEADLPDLYGILFFNADGSLKKVIPGQAASGSPYWSADGWDISRLPVVTVDGVDFVGPALPANGRSGWILIRQPLRDGPTEPGTSIALHLRLASLTELLGGGGISGVVAPLLRAPDGTILDATGRVATGLKELTDGPRILPGWSIVLDARSDTILEPLAQARLWLYVTAAIIIAFILLVFLAFSRSLRRRIGTLVTGAGSLAAGDLGYRLPEGPNHDEISRVGRAFNTMAEQLSGLIDRMVRAEKMAVLGEFATGVAHEVRNPLATMKTTVQALTRQERDPDRQELLTDMGSQIDRLSRVVSDLLTYGRPSPPSPRPVAAGDLLRQTVSLLRPLAEEQGITLSTGGETGLLLFADPDQMVHVLVNLGLNAVQACRAGGAVTMRVTAQGGQVVLTVSDDGCGIAPEHLASVLTPFFTQKPRGIGLGLTISQQMIDANAGSLQIASVPGEGTTVTLHLPLAGSTLKESTGHG